MKPGQTSFKSGFARREIIFLVTVRQTISTVTHGRWNSFARKPRVKSMIVSITCTIQEVLAMGQCHEQA